MRPVAAVSDFSAKMSKHFHYSSVMPLSEANLSKHTLQSPPSREAKLKHILVYVDLQRELIELEEELYRSMTEQNRLTKTAMNGTAKASYLLLVSGARQHQQFLHQQKQLQNKEQEHGHQPQERPSSALQRHQTKEDGEDEADDDEDEQAHDDDDDDDDGHEHEQDENQLPAPHLVDNQNNNHNQTESAVSPLSSIALGPTFTLTNLLALQHEIEQIQPQSRTSQQKQSNRRQKRVSSTLIPDAALDPSLALPRALPRSTPLIYRDSFYSGPEDEQPDSPTLPHHRHQEPLYASFDENMAYNLTRQWSREERHQRPGLVHQNTSTTGGRPVQYRRRPTEDSDTPFPGLALTRTIQTQPESKKGGGILARFSFLGRGNKLQQQHQPQILQLAPKPSQRHQLTPNHPRHESAPGTSRAGTTIGKNAGGEHVRFHSLNYQEGETFHEDDEELIQTSGRGHTKRRSKVKQFLQDLFKKAPTTNPATRPSGNHAQQKQQEYKKKYPGSGHGMMSSGTIIVPRDEIPQRAATSLSHYGREQHRESLVDPAQHLPFQRGLSKSHHSQEQNVDGDGVGAFTFEYEDDLVQQQDSNSIVHAPFPEGHQTSLTPPPPSSVARHSTSSHNHPFLSISASRKNLSGKEGDGAISPRVLDLESKAQQLEEAAAAAEASVSSVTASASSPSRTGAGTGTGTGTGSGAQRTRPSSQLLPIAGAIKELMTNKTNNNNSNNDLNTTQNDTTATTTIITNNISNNIRRFVALSPEQHADLDEVGIRQSTFGLDSA
ncbi:hypothetical protein BGZ83_007268 [Gryganskiella cystojenkinii]|nr:hypothetical protein BGZ83_007268 [Gryganskiella cystojenkinii]